MEIQNCAAIVTGAANGLGAATARALAGEGARVAGFDLDSESVAELARETRGIGVACDIASASSAEAALAEARKAHGPARIIVNCAGVTQPPTAVAGPDGPMPLDVFERLIAVDLCGTFNMTRLAVADMMTLETSSEESRGVVINVSSLAAESPPAGQIGYVAAKGGISSMTLALAREFGDAGIRVLAIAPGAMRTPRFPTDPDIIRAMTSIQPFPRRVGEPAEFAALVIHICRNEFLNGDLIRIDAAGRLPYGIGP